MPHGFRSSFRDWAAEQTNTPREVVEAALAHTVRNPTEAAYARSDLFARRRRLDALPHLSGRTPDTTDFGIMFLATEGLYAEVLRQPELVEELQQRYRVVVAGPTTLVAILTSLRMGFQTLAIEQRAAQVWRILGAVRTEFDKFGGVLEKVKRQLNSASRTIEQTGVRSRAMERTLRSVEQMPDDEAARILNLPARSEEIAEAIEREETETTTDTAGNDEDDGV